MKAAIATIALLFASAYASGGLNLHCNGDTEPDYGDCQKIINHLKASEPGEIVDKPNECYYISPPAGVDPNSLNCRVAVCFDSNAPTDETVPYAGITGSYKIVEEDCGELNAGGYIQYKYHKTMVTNNPDFNPSKKRGIPEARPARLHARELAARGGDCTDGKGTYQVEVTAKNIERPGTEIAVTGRLPAGSTYTIQKSDEKTIGVDTSVSVEAGFFDLFDASASVSVSGSYSVTTTTGVTINVDCEDGQEGIVYLYPRFTEYEGSCTSDNDKEINVFVPEKDQNNYEVRCLGSGSGSK